MDIRNSLIFLQPLTPLKLSVCHKLADLFLDTDIHMFILPHHAWCIARLPISIAQVSDLFWYDVYSVFVWNLLVTAGQWAAWLEEGVKGEIEGRRFSVLSRLNRWWTWPLMTMILYRLVTGLWKEMEERIVRERKKREYVVNWERSVGWTVVTWRANEVLTREKWCFDRKGTDDESSFD